MAKQSPQQRITELTRQIRHHDRLYYQDAQPEISDLQYDRLMAELVELERAFPSFAATDSPTRRVGGDVVDSLQTVPHRVPMLSIDNTYSRDELKTAMKRIEKALDGESVAWVMEYKIDGVAGSVRYENGHLVLGLTRGNGVVGD